jgi:hypothetical protein
VAIEQARVVSSQRLEQTGRALDVSEQEGHGPGREASAHGLIMQRLFNAPPSRIDRAEPATKGGNRERGAAGVVELARLPLPAPDADNGMVNRSASAVVDTRAGFRARGRRSEGESVAGGRHWTRTSDLLHIKHLRLSAVLARWRAGAKSAQLYGHGELTLGAAQARSRGLSPDNPDHRKLNGGYRSVTSRNA